MVLEANHITPSTWSSNLLRQCGFWHVDISHHMHSANRGRVIRAHRVWGVDFCFARLVSALTLCRIVISGSGLYCKECSTTLYTLYRWHTGFHWWLGRVLRVLCVYVKIDRSIDLGSKHRMSRSQGTAICRSGAGCRFGIKGSE